MRFATTTFDLLFSSLFALSLAGCSPIDGNPTGVKVLGNRTEITFATDEASGDMPRFSPDSAKIAFAKTLPKTSGDETELVVMDPGGLQQKTLTPADNFFDGAAWTPDGKQIYFVSGDGISVVAAEGGTSTAAVMAFAAKDPDVSPDGKSLVYAINGGSLKLVDLATPTTSKDLGTTGTAPRFSPDGKSIAFESAYKIKTMELASGTVTEIVDAGTYLASADWFPDGKRLGIVSDKGIEIVTLGASPERTLARDQFKTKNIDISADGKLIVYGVNGSKSIFVLRDF